MKRIQLVLLVACLCGCVDQPQVTQRSITKISVTPTDAVLQEIHDLCAEKTRLRIHHPPDHPRFDEIERRLAGIHEEEMGEYEPVADRASLDCSEEPAYGQPSYGVILRAIAIDNIRANELLLFHADRVYRSQGSFRKLNTDAEGWYFRPNADIPRGKRFVVACIQDAPEEIQNVKNGFMPNSDRARDPNRPYATQIFGSDDQPLVHLATQN